MKRRKRKFKPRIVVDFDGTIADDVFPEMGDPRPGVIEALNKLKKEGFEIIIHSCRTGSYFKDLLFDDQFEMIKEYMGYYKMPFDSIWVPDKPIASAYIDDKAVKYKDNWDEITDKLIKME